MIERVTRFHFSMFEYFMCIQTCLQLEYSYKLINVSLLSIISCIKYEYCLIFAHSDYIYSLKRLEPCHIFTENKVLQRVFHHSCDYGFIYWFIVAHINLKWHIKHISFDLKVTKITWEYESTESQIAK